MCDLQSAYETGVSKSALQQVDNHGELRRPKNAFRSTDTSSAGTRLCGDCDGLYPLNPNIPAPCDTPFGANITNPIMRDARRRPSLSPFHRNLSHVLRPTGSCPGELP